MEYIPALSLRGIGDLDIHEKYPLGSNSDDFNNKKSTKSLENLFSEANIQNLRNCWQKNIII